MNNDYSMLPISTSCVDPMYNDMVYNSSQINVSQHGLPMTQDVFSSLLGMSTPGRTTLAGTGSIENAVSSRDAGNVGTFINPVSRSKQQCFIDGCTKMFQKTEHLKRHQKVNHNIGGTPETYKCPAEGCGKSFKGRADNYKQHLQLHKNGSARTPYDEAAAKRYDTLCQCVTR